MELKNDANPKEQEWKESDRIVLVSLEYFQILVGSNKLHIFLSSSKGINYKLNNESDKTTYSVSVVNPTGKTNIPLRALIIEEDRYLPKCISSMFCDSVRYEQNEQKHAKSSFK